MSALFEQVYIHDYDESKLSFSKRYANCVTIEVIDESDKLLIRSKDVAVRLCLFSLSKLLLNR